MEIMRLGYWRIGGCGDCGVAVDGGGGGGGGGAKLFGFIASGGRTTSDVAPTPLDEPFVTVNPGRMLAAPAPGTGACAR